MIKVGTESAVSPGHLRGNQLNFKTQLAQQRSKEPVEFITETAAPPDYDLFEESIVIKHDRFVSMNAKIFERHGSQVCQMQETEGLIIGSQRARIINSLEIGVKIHTRRLSLSLVTLRVIPSIGRADDPRNHTKIMLASRGIGAGSDI